MKHVNIWGANIALGLFYLYFAYGNFSSLGVEFKFSVALLLLFNTSAIVFAFVRRSPQIVTRSAFDYVIALVGTCSPLLFLGMPQVPDHWTFFILQIAGLGIAYAGLLSLNRSFGLVPADRGIQTKGMYRFVRHPLYAGYVLLCFGFLLQNFSFRNLVVFAVFAIFESLRLLLEEQFLSQNPAYATYMQKVRWRVIPFLW